MNRSFDIFWSATQGIAPEAAAEVGGGSQPVCLAKAFPLPGPECRFSGLLEAEGCHEGLVSIFIF